MPVKFATPIAHKPNEPGKDADYSEFEDALCCGRPFRQPYVSPIAATPQDYAIGLELFLSSVGSVAAIYAWLDGIISFEASAVEAQGDRLVLETDPTVMVGKGAFPSLLMLERPPKRLVFENVDRAAVRSSLEALLNSAYQKATGNPKTWHPCLSMPITQGTFPSTTVKEYLDKQASVAAAVATLATSFVASSDGDMPGLRSSRVKAGEMLGCGAPYLVTDPRPSNPPKKLWLGEPNDPARARRVTLIVEDSGDSPLNPLYYLHILLRRRLRPSNPIIEALTSTGRGDELVHPLSKLLPALNEPSVPPARTKVAGTYRHFTGKLNRFHGYPFPPYLAVSTREWRYVPAGVGTGAVGEFEARLSTPPHAGIILEPRRSERAKVEDFWSKWAQVTNKVCERLQVPAELVVAFACTESLTPLNPRSIRFEPLRDGNRKDLVQHADLELAYDEVVGSTLNITSAVSLGDGELQLQVELPNGRELSKDKLKGSGLVAGEVDRLEITGNSAGAKSTTSYKLYTRPYSFSGGGPKKGVHPAATTRYYSPHVRNAGQGAIAAVERTLLRPGVLRRLRFEVVSNSLPGETIVTVMRNGTPSTIQATLGAGPKRTTAEDLTHEVAATERDRIALRITTPEGTKSQQLKGITWTLEFSPPKGAESYLGSAYLIEGYSPGTVAGENVPKRVPDPLGDFLNKPIRPQRKHPLTWKQLEEVMEALGGDRVSPGLLQTLVSTAKEAHTYLDEIDPGSFAAIETNPPGKSSDYTEWLCEAKNSLLLGAAYLRKTYHYRDTRFDIPVMGAAYNQGPGFQTSPNRHWGSSRDNPDWDYPERIAVYFNAAVAYFEGVVLLDPSKPPQPPPSVRFLS